MILWDLRNITFSYERILSPRQSVSLELGYLVMPRLFDDTISSLINITSHQKQGVNVTLEDRFYLSRLNVRPIPAGLYIGPYLTYYGGKTQIAGNLSAEEIKQINEDLYDRLVERFPTIQMLSTDKTYKQTGKLDIFRMGFRYLVQFGFLF